MNWASRRRFGIRTKRLRRILDLRENEMEQQKSARPVALALTILSALARLLPHPPNFTPVGGMSLFAGARLAGWYAYLVPLAMMAVTDALLAAIKGTPASLVSPFVYASFLIDVWIGRTLLARSENPI